MEKTPTSYENNLKNKRLEKIENLKKNILKSSLITEWEKEELLDSIKNWNIQFIKNIPNIEENLPLYKWSQQKSREVWEYINNTFEHKNIFDKLELFDNLREMGIYKNITTRFLKLREEEKAYENQNSTEDILRRLD